MTVVIQFMSVYAVREPVRENRVMIHVLPVTVQKTRKQNNAACPFCNVQTGENGIMRYASPVTVQTRETRIMDHALPVKYKQEKTE